MKRLMWLIAAAALPFSHGVHAQSAQDAPLEKVQPAKHQRNAETIPHGEYDVLVATHAQANGVPEVLIHRVIVRESGYRPALMGRGGAIGLMQIKLATARSLGYTGDASGLRDPNTNLTYAVKYLAGAYRAANGDHERAIVYYSRGYYEVAKRQRLETQGHRAPALAGAPQNPMENPANAHAEQVPEPLAR
jgi:soluble lytic murein transglycosylase-like protein